MTTRARLSHVLRIVCAAGAAGAAIGAAATAAVAHAGTSAPSGAMRPGSAGHPDATATEAAPIEDSGTLDPAAIWRDAGFQRSLVGGFGISSEVEPRVTPDDLALLELVRQLLPEEMAAAEALLRESVRPDASAILDLTLGGVRFQEERLDEALADFREAVAKFPAFRRAYRNIGLICTRQGKWDEAIAAFNRMIELGGADPYSYGLLGYCHSQRQDFQPAEAAYRTALLLQPDNVEWRLGLTRSVFKQGKYEDAASLLDVLIAAYPERAEFWLLQAHTFLGLRQPLKAAVNLEAVEALGKATPESLYTLGDVYLGEALPDLAAAAYARAIARNPDQAPARAVRAAETLAARGGATQARTVLRTIQQTWGDALGDTDRRRLLKLQARLAMREGGSSEEAVAVLEELVTVDPLDGDALLLLGQHYGRHGEPDKAILAYERAARIDAVAPAAKIAMAQVYVAQSRFAEAIPLLRDAQALRPREDVARYIEQVERASRAAARR